MPKRYAIRLADGMIPTAVVSVPTVTKLDPYTVHQEPVKKFHGFTPAHAWNRALAWTQAHGDPR